jgi:predicted PurR-regulated permease PerM
MRATVPSNATPPNAGVAQDSAPPNSAVVLKRENRSDRGYAVVIKPRTLWLAAAVILTVVIGLYVLTKALPALVILLNAIVLAEGLRPIVDRLSKGPLPRPVVTLLLFFAIFAILLGLGFILLRPLFEQLLALVNDLPRYITRGQRLIAEVQQRIRGNAQVAALLGALSAQAQSVAGKLLPTVLGLPVTMLGVLFKVLQLFLFAFFWLTAAGNLKGFILGMLPSSAQPTASETIADMSRQLGAYLRGTIINMTLIGSMVGGAMFLLGVPYAILLGFLAAAAETLPFIGPWISGTPAVLLALVAAGPLKAVEVIVAYQIVQIFEGNVLVPVVMNKAVHLNPLTITLGIVIGSAVFGLIGILLAGPVTVIVQVLALRVLAPTARRAAGHTPRATPAPTLVPHPHPPDTPAPPSGAPIPAPKAHA